MYMLNYPNMMRRCQAEIDDVIGRHRAPSMKDKASMPYVEATLMEIWRLSSIVSFGVKILQILSKETRHTCEKILFYNSFFFFSLFELNLNLSVWKYEDKSLSSPPYRFFMSLSG